MNFPWHRYRELPLSRRNTLQVYITNKCNLRCPGCFARKVMAERDGEMSLEEYREIIRHFLGLAINTTAVVKTDLGKLKDWAGTKAGGAWTVEDI